MTNKHQKLNQLLGIQPQFNFAEEVPIQTRLVSNKESRVQVPNSAPKPTNNLKLIPMKLISDKKIDVDIKNLILKRLTFLESKDFVSKNHYSCSQPNNTKVSYGFFIETKLCVVITFGNPIGRSVVNYLKVKQGTCLELTRIASLDEMPKNTESYCISKSLKQLKKDYPEISYLISYADTNEGHCGYVYQASNWKYLGLQQQIMIAERFYIDGKEIHSRNLNNLHKTTNMEVLKNIYGDRIEKQYGVKKHVYIFSIGSLKETNIWYSNFKFLPYPKAENNIIKGYYKNDNS